MKEVPLISILITHYNRPTDLVKCIKAIRDANIANCEIVVSDDGSALETIKLIQSYGIDTLILSDINKGLAANINKGLKACKGEYVIYCQEDFMLNPQINNVLFECIELLKSKKFHIVRFTSNFKFNKLIKLTDAISLIPRFSFKNFTQNYYRYSDHPFITKRQFYNEYGYYLENTSGRYGETEYGIRICNSKAKIAITNNSFASIIVGSQSVLINEFDTNEPKIKVNKSFIKLARAFRLYFEWVFYRKNKRGLISYTNARKIKIQ
ncbi:Glycosyltransferase involved in cell wall bisynthesis [Flaviramulus basaltis]|uniref:Glycosyltransferase involved in cell wall bisynthesis n=1 Tax=Flaviramulus basaltis TaxID=369401 RepID=A0A1K2IKW5_9FLAO|nr:glycosyltransferase family 2 protein [Flaviramulus basaltis]SFZ92930.1 Glycosyltransferase involved in cell wall bisynthesis [Flaviramulus basaltis]